MLTVAFLLGSATATLAAEGLDVLRSDEQGRPGVQMLRDYLREHAHRALDRRLDQYDKLQTPDEVGAYQQRLRAAFVESLGGFPEKTPLRARVVGTLSGEGYRAEKLIYQSRPGFYVTAVLYLPKAKPPYPGVLFPCGHSENGKAAEAYQRACILLARNGMAVLCYDPVGQGERKQILETTAAGRPLPKGRFGATGEHMLEGVAPILLGQNLATYRIWDGIRSIDYLVGRPEVDASRIGCTGNSGGGLMTSYLMALDERIAAAAPGCFITTTRRKNESPGPGDAEQNIFGQIAYGMDHPDYIMMRAPKPTLICAATRDFVPIQGTWEAFRQAKRLYARLGFAERVDLVETDRQHGFTRDLRVGTTRFMRRWLLGIDDAVTEPDFPIHSDQELQCTPEGQVLLMAKARSIFDWYAQTAAELAEGRKRRWEEAGREDIVASIRRLAGIRPLAEIPEPRVDTAGSIHRDGYRIDKLVLRPEAGIVLPGLLFVPHQSSGQATLYLDGEGKHADAQPGGPIERLVRKGQRVLAVDLRGYGETETRPWRYGAMSPYVGNNAAEYFVAYMLGRSFVGMRAEDVLASARFLAAGSEPPGAVHLVAVGTAGVPALHAAASEPELFASVLLRRTLDSWQRVIQTPVTVGQLENTVHGALGVYDLPDLVRLCGPDKVTIEDPRDAAGRRVSSQ